MTTDIKDVMYVINFDFPNNVEDYIHRIGRTGRAGAKGTAYTFFTADKAKHAKELARVITEAGQQVPAELSSMSGGFSGGGGGGRQLWRWKERRVASARRPSAQRHHVREHTYIRLGWWDQWERRKRCPAKGQRRRCQRP